SMTCLVELEATYTHEELSTDPFNAAYDRRGIRYSGGSSSTSVYAVMLIFEGWDVGTDNLLCEIQELDLATGTWSTWYDLTSYADSNSIDKDDWIIAMVNYNGTEQAVVSPYFHDEFLRVDQSGGVVETYSLPTGWQVVNIDTSIAYNPTNGKLYGMFVDNTPSGPRPNQWELHELDLDTGNWTEIATSSFIWGTGYPLCTVDQNGTVWAESAARDTSSTPRITRIQTVSYTSTGTLTQYDDVEAVATNTFSSGTRTGHGLGPTCTGGVVKRYWCDGYYPSGTYPNSTPMVQEELSLDGTVSTSCDGQEDWATIRDEDGDRVGYHGVYNWDYSLIGFFTFITDTYPDRSTLRVWSCASAEIPPLRMRQRNDKYNTPRAKGRGQGPSSLQFSERASRGKNTYLFDDKKDCGCQPKIPAVR
ncbi:MAG: hypothetical protein ACWGQW_06525, partial [bacterium]